METKVVSVVIPTLNEEEGLQKVLDEIPKEELEKIGYKCEIIVVDGGSIDRTREIAHNNGTKVIVEPRRGYGRAYRTGFLHASGDVIVTLDGDHSYPASLVPRLVKLLDAWKLDFISADRLRNFSRGSFPIINYVGNKMLTYMAKLLFRVNINDSQSGMWVFKRSILREMDLFAEGMEFSEEIKVLAFRFFRAMEVPIPYRRRVGKRKLSIITDGIKNALYLFALKWRVDRLLANGRKLFS